MSNDAAGYGPTAPPPGMAPPGYPAYPPPGYPGYPSYPGYPGYGPAALKPGVIPLRPLTLADIFNGAFAYIRANPIATLGLTTIVVVVAQLITLGLQIGPLALGGRLSPALAGDDVSTTALAVSSVAGLIGYAVTALSAVLLSGLLTVVVGRAVFGSGITIAESWQRLRGRLWALIGFTMLEGAGVLLTIAAAALLIAAVGFTVNGLAAVLVGIPVTFGAIAALAYALTMLSFAPPLIVLERLPVTAAISRSFSLVRNDFWRVLGIRLLAGIVAGVLAAAVSVPFSVGGQIVLVAATSTTAALAAMVLIAVGAAIGQIITAPFSAGVVVLLYADRRMRAEAFDLVLQTGAAQPGTAGTDQLWLTRRP